jgi:5-oxoprolinase (ATP-hydrolysing)
VNTLWHICIDTGGTFTDCIATSPDGQRHRAKVLSSSRLRGTIEEPISTTQLRISAPWNTQPHVLTGFHLRLLDQNNDHTWIKVVSSDGDTLKLAEPMACEVAAHVELTTHEPAPILAARLVTATPADQPLPAMHMRLATTRGTNALLERAGAPLALFITQGFGDLLYIGDQQRPDLFALQIDKRKPLHAHVVQVNERLQSDGSVLVELDEQAVRRDAAEFVKQGITVAAVALMHSYRNDQHEQRIAQILRDVGFEHVSCSAELAPLIEILPRTETAVVDAYLALLIQSYLSDVRKAIGEQSTLHVMTSAGGLVQAADYRAKDSLLSGPAGGVAGAAAAGNASGYSRVIGFDMGGTSTDVARFDGDFEYRFEHTVAGVKVVAPALAIETVAAGGGSICEFVDDRLRVGPRSAGADPGPACYGAGGPLVMTDVNLLMGRLDAEQFEIPIDRDAASRVLDELAQQVASATGKEPDRDGLLDGFLAIANERMADAIASISLRRGYDPADYALVSFGGAGG